MTDLAALPSIADMVLMSHAERLALLARLDALADTVAEARGALRALLHEPPAPAPLLDAKEVARRVGVSVDTVRAKGAEYLVVPSTSRWWLDWINVICYALDEPAPPYVWHLAALTGKTGTCESRSLM